MLTRGLNDLRRKQVPSIGRAKSLTNEYSQYRLFEADTNEKVERIIVTDPNSPHISATDRLGVGRGIFYYTGNDVELDNNNLPTIENSNLENNSWLASAICFMSCDEVPASETDMLNSLVGPVGVFYSVWSLKGPNPPYRPGVGKGLLFDAIYELVVRNQHYRFVTLSPKTEMAKKFHLNNGATLIRENADNYNFEYILDEEEIDMAGAKFTEVRTEGVMQSALLRLDGFFNSDNKTISI